MNTTAIRLLAGSILFAMALAASGGDERAEIDIVHTDLHIYIDRGSPDLHGDVHYTAIVEKQGDAGVRFHSYWLEKDSIHVNGTPVEPLLSADPNEETFYIPMSGSILPGDTVSISIWYRRIGYDGQPGRDPERGGYYFFEAGESRWNDTALHTINYTMSQPEDTRAWIPTIDEPTNKSTLRMHVTVSEPALVVANGEPILSMVNDDGSQTFVFDHPYPIPPYLFAFHAGPFGIHSTEYQSIGGHSIPVASYLYDEDAHMAETANEYMVVMLGVFEELFGEYPFDRYAMIGISPFRWAGMEHNTITTMRRSVYTNEMIIAHEIAHHWWGNLVTCASWTDTWLNEGFASYSEALYAEAVRGIDARDDHLRFFARRYFEDDEIQRYPLHNPPRERWFGRTIYMKGAWTLHMLRELIGDDAFFGGLRAYADAYRFAAATTGDFRSVMETAAERDLGWFFDQWVYEPGYPVYRIDALTSPGGSPNGIEVALRIVQSQTDAPEVFEGPVEFLFSFAGADTTITFWNDERDQEFSVTFDTMPDTIIFDPNDKILKRMESDLVFTEREDLLPETIVLRQNYPNPFNQETVLTYELPRPMDVTLRIVDMNGRLIVRLDEGHREAGEHRVTFNASQYATGVYFAVLSAESFSTVRKMIYMK
jgi:aminopeptidase N